MASAPTVSELTDLLGTLGDVTLDAADSARGVVVPAVSQDSRTVEPGGLYAALPGSRVHGADFAGRVEVGVILTDPEGLARVRGQGVSVPVIVVPHPRSVLGAVSARVYGTGEEALGLLGVTGTNGKTTTTFLLDALFRALGVRSGLIGTIATRVGDSEIPSVRTTPEAPDLHRLLATMRGAGATWCAMEVSSHAIAQHRVDGALFDVAGFTNLSQDHLDFHRDMEDYFAAKAALFTPEHARAGVVVVDDRWGRRLVAEAGVPVTTLRTLGAGEGTGDAADGAFVVTPTGGRDYLLRGRTRAGLAAEIRGASPLAGTFNITNTALALVMLLEAGFGERELADAAAALEVVVPGRMETVSESGPTALVDYSHTPDAITAALGSLSGSGRPLVIVVGAGGERDHGKRPAMGAAAARGADAVIVTDDNPRSEDAAEIRAAVLSGAQGAADPDTRVEEVADRRSAIARAVALAGDSGTVLVAGKGHETGQDFGDRVEPFDDRRATRDAISAGPTSPPGKVHA